MKNSQNNIIKYGKSEEIWPPAVKIQERSDKIILKMVSNYYSGQNQYVLQLLISFKIIKDKCFLCWVKALVFKGTSHTKVKCFMYLALKGLL